MMRQTLISASSTQAVGRAELRGIISIKQNHDVKQFALRVLKSFQRISVINANFEKLNVRMLACFENDMRI